MSTSKTWLMTTNNPAVETEPYLKAMYETLGAGYVCGQLEQGAEGTRHIQWYAWFKKPVRASKIKKLDGTVHIEIVKRDNGAGDYCMKEDTRLEGPFEFGTKPV